MSAPPAGPVHDARPARLRPWTGATVALGLGLVGLAALLVADVSPLPPALRAGALVATAAWVLGWILFLLRSQQRTVIREEREYVMRLLAAATDARRLVLTDEAPRQALATSVVEVTGARAALLWEVDEAVLRCTAAAGIALPESLEIRLDVPSLCGQAVSSQTPIVVRDLHREPTVGAQAMGVVEHAAGAPLRGAAVVPVVASGRSLGVLAATFDGEDHKRVEDSVPLLTLLAADVAVAIEREQAAELRAQAATDPLTQVANVRGWHHALDELGRRGGMVLLDLDHFKEVNDSHGHAAGDAVLVRFAAVLTEVTREHDTVARLGGDEFGVLVDPGLDLLRIVERIEHAWSVDGPGEPTFSAGVARRRLDESVEDLRARCDAALYEAKARGRHRVVAAPETVVARQRSSPVASPSVAAEHVGQTVADR